MHMCVNTVCVPACFAAFLSLSLSLSLSLCVCVCVCVHAHAHAVAGVCVMRDERRRHGD
jgi:hypothetical protein